MVIDFWISEPRKRERQKDGKDGPQEVSFNFPRHSAASDQLHDKRKLRLDSARTICCGTFACRRLVPRKSDALLSSDTEACLTVPS